MSEPGFRQTADEVSSVKRSMREAWNTPGAGYQEMAETLRPAVEHLLDFARVTPGMRVLDAATGTGLAAIEAARRGAVVTGVDFAPGLIAEARRIAEAAGVDVTFDSADIEELPYQDGSFDAVVSSFGAIFAPRHDVVAAELARVLRPGGVLAFSSWKPEGPNYCLMTLTARYLPPPPPHAFSVFDWGLPDYVKEMLRPYFGDMEFADGNVPWNASSPADAIDMLFHRALGPTMYVYRRFDVETKLAVHNDAVALMSCCLQPDGAVQIDRDYLLTRAVRRAG